MYGSLVKYLKYPSEIRESTRFLTSTQKKARRIAVTKNRPIELCEIRADYLCSSGESGLVDRVLLKESGKIWCKSSDVDKIISHYYAARKGGGQNIAQGEHSSHLCARR